jgi:hypothetical protein
MTSYYSFWPIKRMSIRLDPKVCFGLIHKAKSARRCSFLFYRAQTMQTLSLYCLPFVSLCQGQEIINEDISSRDLI